MAEGLSYHQCAPARHGRATALSCAGSRTFWAPLSYQGEDNSDLGRQRQAHTPRLCTCLQDSNTWRGTNFHRRGRTYGHNREARSGLDCTCQARRLTPRYAAAGSGRVKVIRQRSPSDSKSSLTLPLFSRAVTALIIRVPKPSRLGGRGIGPPRSFQSKLIFSPSGTVSRVQMKSTTPCGTESAPYLIALVASSWTARASPPPNSSDS